MATIITESPRATLATPKRITGPENPELLHEMILFAMKTSKFKDIFIKRKSNNRNDVHCF
jgi:hypothetical protein